jgi:hypothetical protein
MGRRGCPESAGFLAASIVPALVLSVLAPLSGSHDIESISLTFVLYFQAAMGAVVLFGMPTFFVLRRFAPGKWWMAVTAGLTLSIPLVLLIPGRPNLAAIAIFAPLTALSALVFRLVWRWLSEWEGTCCGC